METPTTDATAVPPFPPFDTDPKHGRARADHVILFRQVDAETAQTMASLRADFHALAVRVAQETPPGDDQDRAIDELGDACQAAIANLARNAPGSTVDAPDPA